IKGIMNENQIVRMKSNFLSAVSHELKTPLTSIRILSELVESGKQSDIKKIKQYSNLIGQESQRLQAMIENILNSARLEDKAFKISMAAVDLTELINEIAGLMKNSFKKQDIELKLSLELDAMVNGDREALRSVIQNLMDNALKYSPSGTVVWVTVEKSGEDTFLFIRDQGKGIPQNALKYIFQKFYREENEMTRKTKGTGLGLTLVKQILDRHRAKIFVKSKINSGTEFKILFPSGKT
ncbi:sensor histidine kinase, partial [Fibrobacterota bacterium]